MYRSTSPNLCLRLAQAVRLVSTLVELMQPLKRSGECCVSNRMPSIGALIMHARIFGNLSRQKRALHGHVNQTIVSCED
jgi:hypothetical protein